MNEDFIWFIGSPEELEEYKGKHVAIWKRKVTGFGDSAKEGKKESNPSLAFTPEEELISRL